MNTTTIQLTARRPEPFGIAEIRAGHELVKLAFDSDLTARMSFHLDLSPACARELGKALLAQADAADQEGAAA